MVTSVRVPDVCLGHEGVGIVKEIAPDVKALKSATASALLGSLKDVALANTVQLVAKPFAVQ